MTRLDLVLSCVLIAGIAVSALTLGTNLILNQKKLAGMSAQEKAAATPLWRGLIAVLGFAAIVFSIYALLYVHKVSGSSR